MSGDKGGVPEGWKRISISDLIAEKAITHHSDGNHGNLYPKADDFGNEGVPYISAANINDGEVDFSSVKLLKVEKAKLLSKGKAKDGDILFAHNASVGATAKLILKQEFAFLSTSLTLFRVDASKLSPSFLKTFFESKFFIEQYEGVMRQSTRNQVPILAQRKFTILLPPLPEQRKIAAILSTWDDSLATLTSLLAAKRQQKRGLAEALLTGKKRLPGFEGEWESHPLGLLMPQKLKETAGETEYPILSVTVDGIKPQGDHFNKRVASEKTSDYLIVRRGEIAMSGLNFWMGAIDMQTIEDAGIISPAYKVFRVNQGKMDSEFARHFIKSEKMHQILLDSSIQGASIVRRNLDMQSLKESEVHMPTLPEQQAIASILSTLDGEIASLEALKAKVQEQKRGLMDELLTGRVRVQVEE